MKIARVEALRTPQSEDCGAAASRTTVGYEGGAAQVGPSNQARFIVFRQLYLNQQHARR